MPEMVRRGIEIKSEGRKVLTGLSKANPSVIRAAKTAGAKVGLCGQVPSDHPGFADSFVSVKRKVAEAEAALAGDGRTARARRSVGGRKQR
jgi:hypothetical protein